MVEDKNGNILMERRSISSRWKEYCEKLYNYQLTADQSLLDFWRGMANAEQEEDLPIINMSEVEEAIDSLKDGKSPGIDNVSAEMLKNGDS